MQAGLVCEFIDQRWGHDKLVRLLAEYTRGADTPAAIKAAIGVDAAEFDRLFTEQLKRDYGKVFDNLKQLTELRIQAAKRATEANWDEAADSARQALAILPLDVESGSAYLPLAKAQLAQKKTAEAVATLTTYWQRGGHEPDALERLADELYTLGKKSDAAAVMQSINYVAPYDYARHGTFGDWLLELNRPTEALREYRAALGLNPPDMATAHYRMARAYHALKSDREARSAVLQSLEIAPSFRPAQQLLLELARSQPQS
jgi:tetratricopeptide (TPR) repeat protein